MPAARLDQRDQYLLDHRHQTLRFRVAARLGDKDMKFNASLQQM